MRKGIWLAVFAVAMPLAAIACNDGELRSDDFDQSCDVDDDCVIVNEIGFCCSCEEVAINRDDLSDYEEASGCGDCSSFCAQQSLPRCIEGACVAKLDRDCAPGFDYPCEKEECANGAGVKRCGDNGFSYDDCRCN